MKKGKKKEKVRELKVKRITLDFGGILRDIYFRYIPEVITATGAKGDGIVCSVHTYNNVHSHTGRSVRHPLDKFNEFYGEKKALEDTINQGEFSKEGRTALWQAFLLAHKDSKKVSYPEKKKVKKKK